MIQTKTSSLPRDGDRRGRAVLVYGAGLNQIPVIRACRSSGWRVVVIDSDRTSPGRLLADRFLCLNLRDHESILAATAEEDLVGVVARITDHVGLDSSFQVARDRGLASVCPELFEASTSKIALGLHCDRAGLPTPPRYLPEDKIPFEDGPIIVRPDVTTLGKAGIHRVDSVEAMQYSLERARLVSGSHRVDLSKWIDGRDVSVLAHFRRGRARRLALWDEWVALDGENRIHGVGCGMPSVFQEDEEMQLKIDRVLDRLAQIFPTSETPIILSVRVDEFSEIWVIEIHLGVGGDGIAEQLLPAALPGFDAFDLLARAAAGEVVHEFVGECRPRALLRSRAGWRLVCGDDGEALRERCLASLPLSWHPPMALLAGNR